MPKFLIIAFLSITIFAASGCAPSESAQPDVPPPSSTPEPEAQSSAPGAMRMGGDGAMMARHHAVVPDEYAGLTSLVPSDEDSLLRGAEIYEQNCTSCHGDGGMGDGPAGQHLDPPPAPVAHSSRMLGDDYLFWRISDGGSHEPFASAMPRWQDVLNDTDRWDAINYIRALGSGQVLPGRGPMSGEEFDPAVEAERHAEMAAAGVAQGVLNTQEANTFLAVHDQLDRLMAEEIPGMSGGMETMQEQMLAQLVEESIITQVEADEFTQAHDKLMEAGLMQ